MGIRVSETPPRVPAPRPMHLVQMGEPGSFDAPALCGAKWDAATNHIEMVTCTACIQKHNAQ